MIGILCADGSHKIRGCGSIEIRGCIKSDTTSYYSYDLNMNCLTALVRLGGCNACSREGETTTLSVFTFQHQLVARQTHPRKYQSYSCALDSPAPKELPCDLHIQMRLIRHRVLFRHSSKCQLFVYNYGKILTLFLSQICLILVFPSLHSHRRHFLQCL